MTIIITRSNESIVRNAMYDVMGFEKEEFNNESEFISDLKMTDEDIVDVVMYIENYIDIDMSDEILHSLVKVQDLFNWLDKVI